MSALEAFVNFENADQHVPIETVPPVAWEKEKVYLQKFGV